MLDSAGSMIAALSTGRPRISGGKSQSWEMPTRAFVRPRAHTISVALGTKDTMRTARSGAIAPRLAHDLFSHPRPGVPRLFDRALVLDRGDIARVAVEDDRL